MRSSIGLQSLTSNGTPHIAKSPLRRNRVERSTAAVMQRLCTRLRSLAVFSTQTLPSLNSSTRRLLHSYPQLAHSLPLQPAASSKWIIFSPLNASPSITSVRSLPSSPIAFSLLHVRHVSSRERRKRRKPMTPFVSKVKKIKMKAYSSYKSRFRTLSDGTIRRWREGKNHNAHLKSKKARRRLRRPSIVPAAYAKVMKKLNFCG